MPASCTKCGYEFHHDGICLKCGAFSSAEDHGNSTWLQRPLARLVIGIIFSQGLFYALDRLLHASLLLLGSSSASELGLHSKSALILQIMQWLAVLLGALFAGLRQTHPVYLGAILGAVHGIIAIIFRSIPSEAMGLLLFFTLPLRLAAVGAIGAAIGSWIWRAQQEIKFTQILGTTSRFVQYPTKRLFHGPIAWPGVLIGVTISFSGAYFAGLLYAKLLDISGGLLGTESDLHERLIIWEVRIMAILLGGFIAGANTPNPLKQGLAVSLGTSTILLAFGLLRPSAWNGASGVLLLVSLALGTVGGWFGGTVLPPIIKNRPNRGMAA